VDADLTTGTALTGVDRDRDALYRRLVGLAWLGGATWRLCVLISKWHVPLKLNDSAYYSIQAYFNARGHWFKEAGGANYRNWGKLPGAEHPPLTSIIITPASLLANPEFWERATMTLLGIALIPLIAMLGRRIGGRRVGVIAAVIAAVYPNIWLSDALIMSETLTLLLVIGVLVLALRHQERFSIQSALILGVAIGVAGHARSEVLLFAPLLALVGVRSRGLGRWLKTGALVLVATTITVLPWVVYNTSRFDTPVLMSTNEGSVWLGANCTDAYSGKALGGWSIFCLIEDNPPADESTAERSDRRRRIAFDYIDAHRSRLPVVIGARVLRAIDLYGFDDLLNNDQGEERPGWGVWAGIVCWWALAPLAAIGVWRLRRGVRYVIAVPAITVLMITVVFYGAHRLRAPLEPVVVIGAAAFLAQTKRARALANRFVGSTVQWPRRTPPDTALARTLSSVLYGRGENRVRDRRVR
jgi:4-amino-4-deoxy-L-arabinose transferase-like glycosyltransferase